MAILQSETKREGLRRAAYLVLGALALVLIGIVFEVGESGASFIGLAALALWLAGTVNWAQAKGWHWGWGLLGLTLVGALVIALLPDRHSVGASSPPWISTLSRPVQLPVVRLSGIRTTLRKVLPILAMSAILLITLYPPWSYTFTQPGMAVVRKPGPRAFLFSPPSPEGAWSARFGVVLDGSRLLLEFIAVLVSSGLVYVAAKIGDDQREGA